MATGVAVPLSEYLTTNYSPDREWVRGEVRERLMGDGPHSEIQLFFLSYFLARKKELGLRVNPELRLQVSAQNYRVPDVMVLLEDAPFEDIVSVPPLLCIEVLSPDDRMTEMYNKVDDYLAMGVKAVWVVDPRRKKLFSTQSEALMPCEELILGDYPVCITQAEIFEQLDELQAKRG